MFLRNYYNLMARYNLNLSNNVSNTSFGDGSLRIKSNTGNYIDYFSLNQIEYTIFSLTDLNIIATTSNNYGITFGTGNEPVTFDDYKLGTEITSGLNSSKVSISAITYDELLNKFNCSSKHTLSNTTNEEIIIREYGIKSLWYNNSSFYQFYIFRDLLEPYVLHPSESVNVILNASYTMPTIDGSGNVVAGNQAYGLAIE